MSNQQEIESAIREVLSTETDGLSLSDKLFHPNGLFAKLANNAEERGELVRSPLFQAAQQRLNELQLQEADAFSVETGRLASTGTPRMVQSLDVSAMAAPRVG
ncbi:MAG: hypothetical protein U0744_21345 [Gemmataceae bacterium]